MDELLDSVTAFELSEWEAYERAFGPLGPQYRDNALAEIHEQLQMIAYILGAANTGKDQDNPVPEPKQVPRPHEVFQRKDVGDSQMQSQSEPMGLSEAVAFFEARQQK